MVVAISAATNKKSNSNKSRLMRRFCKLFPDYEWCRTNDNPITSTSPTTTYHLETIIDANNTMPNKNEVIEINTNPTSVKFGNETTDGKRESTYFMVSSTETSPTTTIINNWLTHDNKSLESININENFETTLNDYDELTTLPMKDYTDDVVSTPTTPESTTNYEPDFTASSTTKVLDNVTLTETTTSVPTDYTNSAITSTEFENITEVLDNVALIDTATAVHTSLTNICHLIYFIIQQIIKYFCNCSKLNDILLI